MHWAVVVKSKMVNNLRTNGDSGDTDYDCASGDSWLFCLGTIRADEFVKEWKISIEVVEFGNHKMDFMIDSGSDLTCKHRLH